MEQKTINYKFNRREIETILYSMFILHEKDIKTLEEEFVNNLTHKIITKLQNKYDRGLI